MIHALFICSRNRLRSPTAEQIFSTWQGVETDSAGLAPDADTPLSSEQIDWATHIFVMEKIHQQRLNQRFAATIKNKKIICLNIPDQLPIYAGRINKLIREKSRRVFGRLKSKAINLSEMFFLGPVKLASIAEKYAGCTPCALTKVKSLFY